MPGAPTYITTPIYYCNDVPHIGHVYTTTICDIYARFMRLAGGEVFFLTGTDEHGQKVEKSAREKGLTPQQLADDNSSQFQRIFAEFGLTHDDFIRTTQPRHERQVRAFVKRLIDSGAVYLGQFEGWYDEGQEEYYTDTKAKEVNFASPISGRPLVRAKENNYYFRLSAYQARLVRLFADQPGFVRPDARRNEVLGRLREGLQDVPVSRTNFTWGIAVPGDEKHVIYVWIDALLNYITALGLAEPDSPAAHQRARFWPAAYHVIGKEILWFHAVIWPAILMALDLSLPRCVYAHSFWISEGQKMSKSLGNFIDVPTIQRYHAAYGPDAWRYAMAAQGPLGATDADFSAARFHELYTTDLVNTVGNCASRVTAMIERYFDGLVPPPPEAGPDEVAQAGPDDRREKGPDGSAAVILPGFNLPVSAADAVRSATSAMEQFDLPGAVASAVGLLRQVDGFINATEPFKLAKDPAKRDLLAAILYQCAESVRIASLLLWAFMPAKMEQLWQALGTLCPSGRGQGEGGTLGDLARWGGLMPGTKVAKIALFPRVDAPLAIQARE
jgi:methionine--tRNA ligase